LLDKDQNGQDNLRDSIPSCPTRQPSSARFQHPPEGEEGDEERESPIEEIDQDQKKPRSAEIDPGDDKSADGDEENESVVSGSYHDDDEVSTLDIAEEQEKRNRRSLLMAILTACGIILCVTLISKLVNRCMGKSEEMPVADQVAQEAAEEAANQGVAAARNGGLLAQQQSVANLGNPTFL
jgi:hypothetical protein